MSKFKDIAVGDSFYFQGYLFFKHDSKSAVGSQGVRKFNDGDLVY